MSKQTAKTLQMRLGFLDEDLKKPVHDEILKWLDSNIDSVIRDLFVSPEWGKEVIENQINRTERIVKESISSDTHGKIIKELEKELRDEWNEERKKTIRDNIIRHKAIQGELNNWKGIKGDIPKKSAARIIEKKWEHPITSRVQNDKTGYVSPKNIVGYVDMKVTFVYTKLIIDGVDFVNNQINNSNLCWIQTDLQYPHYYERDLNQHSIYFEAKTKIDSLGELFRQLNTYKEFERGDYVIICPDDNEREIIIQQGFYFYKYK
jgi:hypothetical protein